MFTAAHRVTKITKNESLAPIEGDKTTTIPQNKNLHPEFSPEIPQTKKKKLFRTDTSEADDASSLELFQKRISPILRSPKASSCMECHLSGVDLKNYIGKTEEETFASLRSGGLIDLKNPDRSKILTFIKRAPKKESPISREVRKKEFDAFRAWIRLAVKDPELAAAKAGNDQLGPTLPLEVVRHTRKSRVLKSFVENIWSEVGRCVNCHSPELNRNQIGRNGLTKEDVEAISWVVPRNPAATLEMLIESGNIDTDNPELSSLITKPVGLEKHGGGPKFALGSRTDKNYRRFLNDYAAIVNGKYNKLEQLPEEPTEIAVLSKQQLRIVDLPARLDKKLLRVDIFRKVGRTWSKTRWATAESLINGERNMWQNVILVIAPRDSARAKKMKPNVSRLPAGRYLVKIYIDQDNKTKKDRDYQLGKRDFYGQVEIQGEWKPGYQPPKVIQFPAKS